MKVSFTEAANQTTEAPETTALVAKSDSTLATYHDSDVEGEIDQRDVRMPRLNVTAKVGELSNLFDPGSIVLDREVALVKKDQPLNVTAVKIRKKYQKQTEFGEEMGEVAGTAAEVAAQGGQITDRDGDNYYVSVADVVFLIEQPENASPEVAAQFYQQVGGKNYLLALITVRNSAYTGVAVPIFTQKNRRGTVQAISYTLTSKLAKSGTNTWFRPELRPNGETAPEIKEFLSTLSI